MYYQCAEHAVSSSLYILSTSRGVGNPTAIVIDCLRRAFDSDYLHKTMSGMSADDVRTQACFIIARCERTLGKHSLEWFSILARLGNLWNDDVKMAVSQVASEFGEFDQLTAEKLVNNVMRGAPVLRSISSESGFETTKLFRGKKKISKWSRDIEANAWDRLDDELRRRDAQGCCVLLDGN